MVTLESSDNKHVTIVSCNSLAKCSSSHPVLSLGISFQNIEVPLEISVCVNVTMSQVYRVLVIFKLLLPCQGIVVPLILSLH